MQYKGFEFFASEVPEGLVPEERVPAGGGKVFACEIYAAEDEGQSNVLKVFDLVVGKDIADASDEALVFAIMGYIDDHYGELYALAQAEPAQGQGLRAKGQGMVSQNNNSAMIQSVLNQIDSGRITERASACFGFDTLDGERMVFVDFIYDDSVDLLRCDTQRLLILPYVEENVQFAQAVLNGIAEGWKVPVLDWVSQEVANDPKTRVMQVYDELQKLQESAEYQVAAVMAYLDEHCDPDEPLSDDELYSLSEKFVEASGSWFGTTASQQEYLIAFGDLLESGITAQNNPHFSKLGAMETRKLLLEADEQVFGTLVESTAVENCYRYLPNDYNLDDCSFDAVEKAIETFLGLVDNVGELIGEAAEKSVGGSESKDKEPEMLMG